MWKKFRNRENALRIRVSKRPQKDGVHDRENSGVRADTDGKGKDSDNRETGVPAKSANGIPDVLSDGIEDRQAALIAIELLCRFDAAELKPGAAIRLVRGHAAENVFFSKQLDVSL
jgi:hypothetical protein